MYTVIISPPFITKTKILTTSQLILKFPSPCNQCIT